MLTMRILPSSQRRRSRLTLGVAAAILFVLLYPFFGITFNILIRGPAISFWQSDRLRLSQAKDGFDITFESYTTEPLKQLQPLYPDPVNPVPPMIHHIFLGPSDWRAHRNGTLLACQKSCLEMHPAYRFMFWDDLNAEDFVSTMFPGDVYKTWRRYPHVIQKADSLRYMVLYVYGGTNPCLNPSPPRLKAVTEEHRHLPRSRPSMHAPSRSPAHIRLRRRGREPNRHQQRLPDGQAAAPVPALRHPEPEALQPQLVRPAVRDRHVQHRLPLSLVRFCLVTLPCPIRIRFRIRR